MNYLPLLILLFFTSISVAQEKNFCSSSECSIGKDNAAHLNPYYNGQLCENFNPKQADFSSEYLKLQTSHFSRLASEVSKNVSDYNFVLDSLFNSGRAQQNGVIGLDYRRIRIYISKTELDSKNMCFIISGKSNVSGNICDFKGKLEILSIYEITKNYDFPGQATLFAEYQFFEDSSQNHSGYFKGVFECSVTIDHKRKTIKLDDSFSGADGYYNRSYVGIWKSYNTNAIKKCIWGDYRLPFTFDFDCGDGEMIICKKYVENGWVTYNNRSEFRVVDRWWQKE